MRLLALTVTLEACWFVALAGCSTFACRAATVTVVDKKEQARFETAPGAIRTTETGRIEEDVRQSRTVREYWVRSPEGRWYRVSLEQYRKAEIGRELEICN